MVTGFGKNTRNIMNIQNTNKSDLSQASSKSKSLDNNSSDENLSEGYESYTMGNEYITDIKKIDSIKSYSFK